MAQRPRTSRDGLEGHEAAAPFFTTDADSRDRSVSPSPRDTRFAISEEDAPDENDQQDQDQDQEEAGLLHDEIDATPAAGHRRAAGNGQGHKYPPNSLPPSYREAIYTRDPWYKSEVALSMQHYGRICFSGSAALFRRYWPTSRFAQAGFFIIGLWIIVIISGPTWDKSARMGWGKNVDEFLASIPPPPISGDGHFTSLADWSVPACRSSDGSAAVYCSRRAEVKLDIPHAKESFMTSDKIFVYADPPRTNGLSDGRGSIPTSVEVMMDGNLDGQAKVVVEAIYEKEMELLLQRANVGWMAAGLRDRGVGIYTWPLPAQLRSPIYHYPPLSFKVTVHVQPNSSVPTIKIEGSDVDVGIFTSSPDQGKKHPFIVSGSGGTNTLTSTNKLLGVSGNEKSTNSIRADPRALKVGRLGHALGKAHSNSIAARQASTPALVDSPHPLFGNIWLATSKGDLSISGTVQLIGQIWSQTAHGSVFVAQDTNITAAEIHFESTKGDIAVGKNARLGARDELQLLARHGNVQLLPGVVANGTRVNGEATFGALVAPEATMHTNHTLLLRGTKGISANVGISAPNRPDLGVGTEQHAWVGVDAQSDHGNVKLKVVDQQTDVPMRALVEAPRGSVDFGLSPEYSGTFKVSGSKSPSSSLEAPKVVEANGRTRIFTSSDHSSKDGFEVDGSIWWKTATVTTEPVEGSEMFGQVQVKAKASAKVSFE